jgi:hypothetical protein
MAADTRKKPTRSGESRLAELARELLAGAGETDAGFKPKAPSENDAAAVSESASAAFAAAKP